LRKLIDGIGKIEYYDTVITLDQHKIIGLKSGGSSGRSSGISEFDVTRPDGDWVHLKSWNTFITAIAVSPNGALWVADRDGVHIYKDNRWTKMVPPWIGRDAAVSSIAFHPDGSIWFGLSVRGVLDGKCGFRSVYNEELGAYCYDGVNWKQFTTDDGLVDNKICDIAIGPDGDVWFGSFDKGISRFNGTQWTTYVIAEE
jgi:ligand-binding sensor domain-containing protein